MVFFAGGWENLTRWLSRCLIGALIALAPLSAGAAEDFRLLRLGGKIVKWGQPTLGLPSTITYALVNEHMEFPEARNCREMVPIDSLVSNSNFSRQRFVEELEAAFASWEAVAGIRFERSTDPRTADIKLGAQAEPKRWAFADVSHSRSGLPTVQTIDRALICLNPMRAWALDFGNEAAGYNLRYVLLHEIGHAIGLNHTQDDAQVMSHKYPLVRRGLQQGDIRGATILYGAPVHASRIHAGHRSAPDVLPASGAHVMAE